MRQGPGGFFTTVTGTAPYKLQQAPALVQRELLTAARPLAQRMRKKKASASAAKARSDTMRSGSKRNSGMAHR
jgi:hypothetical protein